MPNYRHRSKIVKREELIPPGKLDEGMIITFRYNSGSDKTPVVLVIYYDKKKKMIDTSWGSIRILIAMILGVIWFYLLNEHLGKRND